jgi:(S)-ureidoglycine aminohydrolase
MVLLASPRGRQTDWTEAHFSLPEKAHGARLGEGLEHFFYLLSGALEVESTGSGRLELTGPGAFAYVAPDPDGCSLHALVETEVIWLAKRYQPLAGMEPPTSFASTRAATPALEDNWIVGASERPLLPLDDMAFDFTMKLLAFGPGVSFNQVEIHDEDHGIYMTEGQGWMQLGEARAWVQTDDFIYFAPYCPQHFASASERSEYLIYKPVNRIPTPS